MKSLAHRAWNFWNDLWYSGTRSIFTTHVLMNKSVSIRHRANLEQLRNNHTRGVIVIANHISRADPWIIAHVCREVLPKIHFLAAEDLTDIETQYRVYYRSVEHPICCVTAIQAWTLAVFTKLVVSSVHTILVDRNHNTARTNRHAIARAREVLRKKGTLGIFPEGGIKRNAARGIPLRLALESFFLSAFETLQRNYQNVLPGRSLSAHHGQRKVSLIW